jgi:hypothetical protein
MRLPVFLPITRHLVRLRARSRPLLRATTTYAAYRQRTDSCADGPTPWTTEELAIQHARSYAEVRKIKACLVLDRRTSLWFEPGGIMFQTIAATPSIEAANPTTLSGPRPVSQFGE